MKRLLVIFLAAFLMFGGRAIAQSDGTRSGYLLQLSAEAQNLPPDQQVAHVKRGMGWSDPPLVVFPNHEGQQVAMLLPVPGLPMDGNRPVRPSRPAAPQAPLSAIRPLAPPAPASPQVPTPPVETAAKAPPPSRNYPRGEVVDDQAKRLYLAGQPVGEVRVLKGQLKGELVNVDQNNLHIHIWPGALSKVAIPVDGGKYKIAFATGKGWQFVPETTKKIPAGYTALRIGD
jgi:hypothetical protein